MAENNQRDVDRLVADLSVSSTRSSRVRMVPAGGHFAQGDGAAAPAPTTVGGAAAGRRFRQRTAMDEEEPRPAGARFADSRPAGARFASAHVDEGHVDDGRPQVTRPAGSRFSSSSGAFGPVSSRVPAVPKHGAPEKPDAASVTTAAIDISDSHAATEPLSHGSEVLAAPKPADTAEFTAAATAAAATRSQGSRSGAFRARPGRCGDACKRGDAVGTGVFQAILVPCACSQRGPAARKEGREGRCEQWRGR